MSGGITKKVLRVTGLFTGVEGLGIVCSMVKNKLVAIWLSATGIGLFAIFNQTVDTATYLTSLGLRQSTVRDVAQARGDESRLQRLIRNVRSWSVVVGLLGALVLVSLSWPLARIIMGDGVYWWNFALLGAVMLFNALYSGENAIFQGTENYRRLARTGMETAVTGLLISIPMFRWLGDDSVIFSILSYAVTGVVFAFVNRNRRYPYRLGKRSELKEGRGFVKLGAYLSIAAFVSTLCQLIFVSWLNVTVSTYEAGLYGAGTALVVRYTSLVFNSVGLEFYPRVSAYVRHSRRVATFVNHEVTLLLSIFTPLVLLFIAFAPWVIRLLYSEAFLEITAFVSIGILSVLCRSVSTVVGYLMAAKGDGRVYFIVESLDSLMGLGLCIACYHWLGITGIGVALLLWHLIYVGVTCGVYRLRYACHLGGNVVLMFITSMLVSLSSLGVVYVLPRVASVILLTAGASVYCVNFIRMFRRRKARKSRHQ